MYIPGWGGIGGSVKMGIKKFLSWFSFFFFFFSPARMGFIQNVIEHNVSTQGKWGKWDIPSPHTQFNLE